VFTRLLRRGLWQRKSRALVALSALTVAATLTAALFNLHLRRVVAGTQFLASNTIRPVMDVM